MLYGDLGPKVDLLPPFAEREVDLMEMKGRFRFPDILHHYLVNISREAICQFFREEFRYGICESSPFLITGRVSVKKLFGSKYRVVWVSKHDMVLVSGDRHGQVVSSLEFIGSSVENIANYLFRPPSEERFLADKAHEIGCQKFIDENGGRCRRAGLTGFHLPEELRGRKRRIKDIVKILHHCKTLERFAIIDRDRKEKAAIIIQRAWWTFWLKPGRKGVACLEERFRASCGV